MIQVLFLFFLAICEQLTKFGVVSPLLVLDEMSSLRSQYRLSVHRMLVAALHKSNKVFRTLDKRVVFRVISFIN